MNGLGELASEMVTGRVVVLSEEGPTPLIDAEGTFQVINGAGGCALDSVDLCLVVDDHPQWESVLEDHPYKRARGHVVSSKTAENGSEVRVYLSNPPLHP